MMRNNKGDFMKTIFYARQQRGAVSDAQEMLNGLP